MSEDSINDFLILYASNDPDRPATATADLDIDGKNAFQALGPGHRRALHDIWKAETKAHAEQAFELFLDTYEAKYPKATACLQKDREELLAFYSFPAKHWQSLRTSNPIESAFGTIRHRTKRSKGCLSRDGMLHMMFKLGMCAEQNWRKLRGFDYLAKVIEGVQFRDGIEVKENETKEPVAA